LAAYTLEQVESAIREADKAGNREDVLRLGAYRETLLKQAPEPKQATSFSDLPGNLIPSAARYASDIWTAISHPVDTAKGIGVLAGSLGNKLGRQAAELVTGQEQDVMPEHSEFIANAAGKAIKERYGSLDAIKNTLVSDPVGALADVSGLGAVTGKIGKVQKLAQVSAAAEPLNLATSATKAAVKLVVPEKTAQKLYQSAAKFSTTLSPAQRNAIVQTALDQGIMPTSAGVVKVQNRIDVLNAQIDELINAASNSGASVPVGAIFQHLDDLRKSKGGVKIESTKDINTINKIAKEFHKALKGKETVTPKELQAFKVDAYKRVKWNPKTGTVKPIKEDTFKALARGAKDAIEGEIPQTADINKLLGELYELQPHLKRTANRIDNRNLLSINAPLNVAGGGVLGSTLDATGIGVSAGLIGAVLGNPKTKARLAIALNKMKDGDVSWLNKNIGTAEVRVALALAGRNEENVSADQPTSQ